MFGKISIVIVGKYKVMVSKKIPFTDELTSYPLESPSSNSLLPIIMEQLHFVTNKFDCFTRMWVKKAGEVDKLFSNIQ
jgi:hypothetical protein